jgi:hypothetical protein
MVVSIYPLAPRVWSFREEPGAEPVEVKVPDGSEVLPVRGLGLDLFVPSEGDELQRIRWSANSVMREAQLGGRFKLVGSGKLERAAG